MDFDKFSLPGFSGYFAFISMRKEAIDKIQTDSRSRNDTLSSDKIFLFRKLIMKIAMKYFRQYYENRNDISRHYYENRNDISQALL